MSDHLSAAAVAKLEAIDDRAGKGFALPPSLSRLVCDVALAAAKLPEPSEELRAALGALLRSR